MAGETFLELVRQYGHSQCITVGPERAWYSAQTGTVTLHGNFTIYELETMMLAMRELHIRHRGVPPNAL